MRKIQFKKGEIYSIYNRGVDGRLTFVSEEDYDRFSAYLYILNDVDSPRASNFFLGKKKQDVFANARNAQLVAIASYCLMPNHFHILATPLVDGGLSKFMQKLQTAYTMYFNEKRQRTGSLFEGTFKARHLSRDAEIRFTYAYIHLNPAKLFDKSWKEAHGYEFDSLAARALQYRYTSISEYAQDDHVITNPAAFPKYLSRITDSDTHIQNWLKFKPKEME